MHLRHGVQDKKKSKIRRSPSPCRVQDKENPFRGKRGVQDKDKYGRPNEFEIDQQLVEELRAYKAKIVEEKAKEEARREGKKEAARREVFDAAADGIDLDSHHPVALLE